MATTDNGAIDYRRRIQSRKNQQSAVSEVVQGVAAAEPPAEPEPIADTAAAAVAVETAVPQITTPTETAMSRTPQAVREQAKAAVVQLLSVSDAAYTTMMTELSAADPILYAAVVDEINDARAAAAKTE